MRKKKLIKKLRNLDLNFDYVSTSINKDINSRLKKFQDQLDNIKEDRTRLLNQIECDNIRTRQSLKKLYLHNKSIYNSIQIINPNIYSKLDKYLKLPEESKSTRKLELVLARTASHALTKTSPIGFLNKTHIKSNRNIRISSKITNTILPNNVFLLYLYEFFLQQDCILPKIQLRKNRNFYVKDNNIYLFVLKDNLINKKTFKTKDSYIKVKSNSMLLHIINSIKEMWNLMDIERTFKLNKEEALNFEKELLKYGFLMIDDYFCDDLNSIGNLLQKMDQYKATWNSTISNIVSELEKLKLQFSRINRAYSLELHRKIISTFNRISAIANLPSFDKNSLLYIDNVTCDKEPFNGIQKYKNVFENIVKLYPIFDINTRIQEELLFELKKKNKKIDYPIETPWLFNMVGNLNLKFQSYWTNPNQLFKCKSNVNQKLEILKLRFFDYIFNYDLDETQTIQITPEFLKNLYSEIPYHLKNKSASYTFFYQLEDKNIVVNKIYPGYQSFYNRFLRYTDIPKKQKRELDNYYKILSTELVDINETVGFNANAFVPILDGRLIFDITRDKALNKKYKKIYNFHDLFLVEKNGEFFLKAKTGKVIKPVIGTSLIRILYPGKIAFYSSLFSNISLISDLACLFFKDIKNKKIIKAPRIVYENMILSRKMMLVDTNIFKKNFSKQNELEMFTYISEILTKNKIPTKFFYQSKKRRSETITSISQEFSKPQYFDLENAMLVKVFINSLRTNSYVLISELYPENIKSSEYITEWNLKAEGDICD